MRTKPTDQPYAMKYLPALLWIVVAAPAMGEELHIDPARLQEQIKQHSARAAQQGAAPSPGANWVAAPTSEAQSLMGENSSNRRGQGYGQGYERRYGQAAERSPEAASSRPEGGMQHGAGFAHGGGGRGAGGHGRQ